MKLESKINQHKYGGDWKSGYNYKGLPIHAGEGVHEKVFSHINTVFPKNSKILVLGAGTGAFDRRLFDHGYTDITSVDINQNNYQFDTTQVNFVGADLNKNFSDKLNVKFDLIIAVEVLEHLFSTDNFLKNCRQIMAPTSTLLISTPNPRSHLSRWRFMLKGYHAGFEGIPQKFEHVNPIHIDILRHHLHFNSMAIESHFSFDHKWQGFYSIFID